MPSHRAITRAVRSRLAWITLAGSLTALLLWSWLALGTGLLDGLDRASLTPRLAPGSGAAQVWSAVAVVTLPGVLATVLLVVSVWAWRRRLRNLAWALVIAVCLTWLVNHLLKRIVDRPRPPSVLGDVITAHGWAYPSGHVAMATCVAVMLIATTTTTRQPTDVRYFSRVLGVGLVLLVGWDRFVTNAHWPTDIAAGALVGLACASLACLLARVHMLPVPGPAGELERRVCAVIWNPSKVMDAGSFRRSLEWELDSRGWAAPLWLQTRPDDAGHEMARTAVSLGVELVLVAGGDGTVRVVCSELANTGIALGIIPAGTGNLLARNLGIPLDEVAAAHLAIGGTPRAIDLVRVSTDDEAGSSEHFAVMAGIGVDAKIMEATRPELKKAVGSAAYFLAVPQQVGAAPMQLSYQVDDAPPVQRRATLALVGNVGYLQAGIQMFPEARANDGLLDVLVAYPTGVMDLAGMTARVLTRRGQDVARVDRLQARKVRIEVAEEMPYELDGDTAGRARVFEAEVVPGALLLMQR